MNNIFLLLASLSGMTAVAAGAFAAHGLKNVLSINSLEIFHLAVEYQFYHTFALAIVGILCIRSEAKLLKYAGIGFILGIVLFCGSLYWYAITASKLLVMVTPIGGIFFLLAWVLLAISVLKDKSLRAR